jgi:hypothetical protein
MNRIQFFVLIGLSGLLFLLLMGHLYLGQTAAASQSKVANAQAFINQASAFANNYKSLATYIAQASQKSNDPALKDLLARQGIAVKVTPAPTGTETPATPTTH